MAVHAVGDVTSGKDARNSNHSSARRLSKLDVAVVVHPDTSAREKCSVWLMSDSHEARVGRNSSEHLWPFRPLLKRSGRDVHEVSEW